MKSSAIIDREYLDIRSKILQIGASLDRIERAGGSLNESAKTKLLLETIEILLDGLPNRAERIQLTCSRPYDPNWINT
ncbi:MAG: hypothetical protein ABL888_14860 [Pirellulaceae bacterium]